MDKNNRSLEILIINKSLYGRKYYLSHMDMNGNIHSLFNGV